VTGGRGEERFRHETQWGWLRVLGHLVVMEARDVQFVAERGGFDWPSQILLRHNGGVRWKTIHFKAENSRY
jgi:hypothetical protein